MVGAGKLPDTIAIRLQRPTLVCSTSVHRTLDRAKPFTLKGRDEGRSQKLGKMKNLVFGDEEAVKVTAEEITTDDGDEYASEY